MSKLNTFIETMFSLFCRSTDSCISSKIYCKASHKASDWGACFFEVRVESDSAPEVTWYKGDTVVEHGGLFKITIQADGNNYILQLEISSLTPDDGGLYKVTARNAHGASNASLNLNLEG